MVTGCHGTTTASGSDTRGNHLVGMVVLAVELGGRGLRVSAYLFGAFAAGLSVAGVTDRGARMDWW